MLINDSKLKLFHCRLLFLLAAQRKEEVAGIRAKFPTKVPVSQFCVFLLSNTWNTRLPSSRMRTVSCSGPATHAPHHACAPCHAHPPATHAALPCMLLPLEQNHRRLWKHNLAATTLRAVNITGVASESFTMWLVGGTRAWEQCFSMSTVSPVQKVQTSSIKGVRVWVSPPSINVLTTHTQITDWQNIVHRLLPSSQNLGGGGQKVTTNDDYLNIFVMCRELEKENSQYHCTTYCSSHKMLII